jgi:hypothetical protein
VLRTRSHGDFRSGKDLSPLPHLRIQLKKFNLKLKMPLKWQLNPKLRKSLKDSILKMETPMRRAKNIAWGDRNAPTQLFWEIMVSGWTIVTPSFKGKTECIDHVCARIKLHTRLDIMNTKNNATQIKSYYKP